MGTKPGPARVAQRVSVNQTDVDRWTATVSGPQGPVTLAEGPMVTYGWMTGMLRMAAAAAAAKLAPVDAATTGGEAADGAESAPDDAESESVVTVPASGPAAVSDILSGPLAQLSALRGGAQAAGVELRPVDPPAQSSN